MDLLVGHTGLVGGTLRAQRSFDLLVNRANLEALAGVRARRLVLSALPAEKWRINQAPDEDLANMRRLQEALERVGAAEEVVVVSTVDVYGRPVGVDEGDAPTGATPYGAHRLAFERWVRERFPRTTVIRLPGLFGAGLKKNALHDLARDHETHKLDPRATLQWYPLARLADDIDRALALRLPLVHAAVAPLATGEIAARLFPTRRLADAAGLAGRVPATYDLRSRHAEAFGGHDGHWMDADALWPALEAWAATSGR